MTCLTGFVFLVMAATSVSGRPAQDRYQGPEAEIEALFSRLMTADNEGDLEGVLACYAADAVLMPPEDLPVKGIDAIRPRYSGLFESARLEVKMESEELEVDGSWAFSRGTTKGRIVPKDGSSSRPLHDKYLMILRKEDGWRIAVLMWSPMQPD